uniref:Uncharacterized protein n=1 Tax=Timema shepardi TaxID=629360 RepID=A0A7R9AN00_TIMSH|nr:unnamed protein product [Timema shepardi]
MLCAWAQIRYGHNQNTAYLCPEPPPLLVHRPVLKITCKTGALSMTYSLVSTCKACCKFGIGRGKEEVISAHHRPSSLVPGSVQAAACITAGVSVNCQDDIGSTPLNIAAAYGRVELVDALVREGAEIDRPNNFGWTPIMQAARNGQSTVAIKLLNNGVNVNLKNKLGANLLALAVASNDEKTITAVINDMSHKIVDLSLDPLPLVIASLQGFTDVVSTLLKKGFNPNTATSCTGGSSHPSKYSLQYFSIACQYVKAKYQSSAVLLPLESQAPTLVPQ